MRRRRAPIPTVTGSWKSQPRCPANAKAADDHHLQSPAKADEGSGRRETPRAGARTFSWDFKNEDGRDSGTGHFIYRVLIDGNAESGMVVRAARAATEAPEDLPNQVVQMITRMRRDRAARA